MRRTGGTSGCATGDPDPDPDRAPALAGPGSCEVLAKEVGPFGIKVTVLEPGGMQTDWAGSSMRVPPISEPYQPTVGAMARLHNDLGSTSALGDPAKWLGSCSRWPAWPSRRCG